MKGTLDRLHGEMDERFVRLHDTDAKFDFLLDFERRCYRHATVHSNDLKKQCEYLGNFYYSDLDGQQLYDEMLDCTKSINKRPVVLLIS